VDWLAGACLMTRREVFDRAGGLDETFFLYREDADYCRRVSRLGFGATYLPPVTVRHGGGASAEVDLPRAIRTFHAGAFHLLPEAQRPDRPAGRAVRLARLAPARRIARPPGRARAANVISYRHI
jgi:GT2 family glycosyltransferase